ncbi:hypothetical protein [Saccharicrinis sp. FJH54]|uniref:hypothetical protein n=1 Tax=Saccharicrinis sp. FJH54 TaxID=3344665 RepID=UPI0035D4DDC0
MKHLTLLLFVLALSTASFAEKADFSGTWNIDKSKSTLNEQFSMAPNQLILTQDKNTLTIERHSSFRDQDFTFTDKLTLDGKECINKGFRDSEKKSKAVWSDDAKTLIVTTKIPMQDGNELTLVEKYQLVDSNLQINVKASSSYGESEETYVFAQQ